MINKQNKDNLSPQEKEQKEGGIIDIAKMDVNVHLLIKDKDTGETLINQRG